MSKKVEWNEVEATIVYLKNKNVAVNDTKAFDQVFNLNKFIELNVSAADFQKNCPVKNGCHISILSKIQNIIQNYI